MLLAPTVVAAINIDDAIIRTALYIPVGNFKKYLPALDKKMSSSLRYKFSEVK